MTENGSAVFGHRYSFRDADPLGKAVLAVLWGIALPVLASRHLKKVIWRILAGVYIGSAGRWWALSKTSGRTSQEIAQAEIEAFATTVAETLAELLLSLPPWVALSVTTLALLAAMAWKVRRHWDEFRHLWYATTWTQKALLTAAVGLYLYVRYKTDLFPTAVTARPAVNA
jgi:hypothetical protein